MIDCHSTKELMYKRRFMKLSIEVLEELLKQYEWERNMNLEWNGMQIDTLEEVIKFKKSNS